ncbi:MAG: 50S ribosomal protein L25 [Pirellulaceae bacterium]|nr:MAG: 50S ribosomal protein L25 [Pirellulaceae bacterium]
MSSKTLQVEKREQLGTNAVRKLRRQGKIPAILYGHGEENVPLMVAKAEIERVVESGVKLLNLTGAVSETALLRDVAWDSLGSDVLHVDFTRVSLKERVEVTLPVKLRGESPGTSEGGVLEFVVHEITVECPAGSIPDEIEVDISELHLGQTIHAGEVKLPEGAKLISNEHEVIVHVVHPTAETEAVEEAAAGEPEVIGAKEKAEKEEAGA